MKKLSDIVRGLLKTSLITYIIVGLILSVTVDPRKITYLRLDALKDYANYPLLFTAGKKPFNRHDFLYTRRYYSLANKILPRLNLTDDFLGFCYYHLGHDDQAIRAYQRALKKFPHHFWHHYNLGIIQARLKNYKKAAEHFKIFHGMGFEQMAHLLKLEMATPTSKDPAKNSYALSLDRYRDMYATSYRLAVLCSVFERDASGTIELCAKALKQDFIPDPGFYYYHMGWAFLQSQKPGQALRWFEKANEQGLNHPDLHLYSGTAFKALGMKNKADYHLNMARALKQKKTYQKYSEQEFLLPEPVLHPQLYYVPDVNQILVTIFNEKK